MSEFASFDRRDTRLQDMRAEKERREQARKDYSDNRMSEIFAQPGMKKFMKDAGYTDKGGDVKKAIKIAKKGGPISESQSEIFDKGVSKYGKITGAHNARGEFDGNDRFSTMLKASKHFSDMQAPAEKESPVRKPRKQGEEKPTPGLSPRYASSEALLDTYKEQIMSGNMGTGAIAGTDSADISFGKNFLEDYQLKKYIAQQPGGFSREKGISSPR